MALMSLDAHAANDLMLVGTGSIFQEEVVFEERKVWLDSKIDFT
jgi:hypothetical protein